MRTCYIYKATNTKNNMCYIGCTYNFKERVWKHLRCKPEEDCVFHRAIEEFGRDSFEWEIIDTADNRKEAEEKEKYWIKKFNTCIFFENSNGYNENYGGVGGHNSLPIVKLSLDGEFIKRYCSAAQIQKEEGINNSDILVNCKNKSTQCCGFLFMYEKDYIENGPKRYIKKTKTGCEKTIIQCDLDGNFIAKYESVISASLITGIRRSTISGNITGTYKTAGGYIFVYEKDFPIKDISKHSHKTKGRKIAQVDIETNKIIKVFDRITDAGRELGVNYKSIHKVCDKPNRTAYGYKWISQ